MMRSLSSGVAGLRSHQTKMDVIGNNIANVNTYGFKSSRTTFADVYYQNLGGASRGTTGVQGGKNPTQIGYGAAVATIDVMNSVSSAATTDYALDVFIAGDGFLVSKDIGGKTMYTRLGKLDFDSAGNLVDGSGNLIQGFPLDSNGQPIIRSDGTIEASDLRSITGNPEILQKLKNISISPTGLIVGTLEGDKVIKAASTQPNGIVKDSISINPESDYIGDVKLSIGALPTNTEVATALTVGTTYVPTVTNVEFGDVGLNVAPSTYTMELDGTTVKLRVSGSADPKDDLVYEGIIQEDGSVTLKSKDTNKVAMTFNISPKPDTTVKSTAPQPLGGMTGLKYQVTTRDKGENIVKLPKDQPGTFTPGTGTLQDLGGITIGYDTTALSPFKPFSTSIGTATPGDDVMYTIGNIAIAKFPNPNGMSESGSSYFTETANSGSPIFVKPGIDGTGSLRGSSLEMSNVDVSKEFTDMITTQRGFQANSRIITVSDTMLEELVNLKR